MSLWRGDNLIIFGIDRKSGWSHWWCGPLTAIIAQRMADGVMKMEGLHVHREPVLATRNLRHTSHSSSSHLKSDNHEELLRGTSCFSLTYLPRMDSIPTTSRLKRENGVNIQRLERMLAARWTYVQRGLRFQRDTAVTATLP